MTSATEHAYYLKHANKRAPYLANMMQIINVRARITQRRRRRRSFTSPASQWGEVDALFQAALKDLPPGLLADKFGYLQPPSEQL